MRELVAPLDERYGVRFDSCLVNLYRDGSDAVAWHADTVRKVLRDPLVATVSLGARRKFQLRRKGTTKVEHAFALGHGDLVVMGGSCQRTWQHAVPKVRAAGPRISIQFRHAYER